MKTNLNQLLYTFFIFCGISSFAQNTYDTYNPGQYSSNLSVLSFPGTANAHSGFPGEYQLFCGYLSWYTLANPQISISYKIEPVSFPFTPDCSNSVCGDANSTQRKLIMPNDFGPYYCIYHKSFGDQYAANILDMSAEMTLYSRNFTNDFQSADQRDFLPHTILRHTYYVHCGASILDPIVDSFAFVIDHTRGEMCRYPFINNNGPTSQGEHDITIVPWQFYGDEDQFLGSPLQTTNAWSTINYFPYPDSDFPSDGCNSLLTPASGNEYLPPMYFLHPSPYSLYAFMLANADEMPFAGFSQSATTVLDGVEHQYTIDRNIDLKLINPAERVIYNPSDVDILTSTSAPLIFPSGYTFKTVGATYPTATEVANADPNNMYPDPREVPVIGSALHLSNNPNTSRDDKRSIYRVKSGCKLKIESCVTIYDAEIIVESGGTLEYWSNELYGNVILTFQSGSTITDHTNTSAVPCPYLCYEASNYNERLVTINSNTTWTTSNIATLFPGSSPWSAASSNTVKLVEGIVITTGNTLTIGSGLNILFGPNAKLIVEPGAKLIVNGTVNNRCALGPACQKEWLGVEVHGDRTLPQGSVSTTSQGYVELNYTDLSHANEGVTLGKPDFWGTEGGIVHADHSTFANNVRDVQFFSYRNFVSNNPNQTLDNISAFVDCRFETTEPLYDASYTVLTETGAANTANIAHVTMHEVRGVSFRNCTFKTDNFTDYQPYLQGRGIYAIDAGLFLRNDYPCTFENLADAVWIQSTGFSAGNTIILGQTFTGNIHGVVLEGTRYAMVLYNEFDVPESRQFGYSSAALEKGYDKPVGVYMIGSTDFRIEENNFNVGDNSTLINPNVSCSDCSYDIVINNTVITDALGDQYGTGTVYKNNIYHASNGLQVEGDNGSQASSVGLDVKCNVFDDLAMRDFALEGRYSPPVSTNIIDQGSCASSSNLAANDFDGTSDPNLQDEQLRVGDNSDDFFYSDKLINQPSAYSLTAQYFMPCNPLMSNNSCSSHLNIDPLFIEVAVITHVDLLNEEGSETERLAHEYDSLIDGGSSSYVLSVLQNNSASVGVSLLDSLSPWLSDTVMIYLVSRRDKFQDADIIDILKANSMLTTHVYQSVLDAYPAFNSTQLTDLANVQVNLSPRYGLESERAIAGFNYNLDANLLVVAAIQKDSISDAISYFSGSQNIGDMQRLFWLQTNAHDYSNAGITLDSIYVLQGNQHSSWSILADATLSLYSDSLDWSNPDDAALTIADSIYQLDPEFNVHARTAVRRHKQVKWLPEPYGIDTSTSSRFAVQTQTILSSKTGTDLKIYPNPNNGSLLTIELGDFEQSGDIQIFNSLGESVKSVSITSWRTDINLAELKNGMYLVVYNNGIDIKTQKLLIQM